MIQKQYVGKSLEMMAEVVSNIYDKFKTSLDHDPKLSLPSGLHNFLFEANSCYKSKRTFSKENLSILCQLLKFAFDSFLPLYRMFFDKIEEIEKEMPLQDSSRVIDCNLLLLLKIRKQLLTRIYSDNDGNKKFSVLLGRFTTLPHVSQWFNKRGGLADNPCKQVMAHLSDAERQRNWAFVVGLPSEFMEEYVNGNPLALLQMYFILIEEGFYQEVMKNVVRQHVRAVAEKKQQDIRSLEERNEGAATKSQTDINTTNSELERDEKYYYIAGFALKTACRDLALSSKTNKKLTLYKTLIKTLSTNTMAEEAQKEEKNENNEGNNDNDNNNNNTFQMFRNVWNSVVGSGGNSNYQEHHDDFDTNEIVDDESNVYDVKHLKASVEDQEIKAGSLTKVTQSLWKCIEQYEKEVLEVFLNSYQALRLYGNTFVNDIILTAIETCDIYNEAIKAVKEVVDISKIFDEGEFKVNNTNKESWYHKLGTTFVTVYFNTVFSDYLRSKVTEVNMHDTNSIDKLCTHRQKLDIEQRKKWTILEHREALKQRQKALIRGNISRLEMVGEDEDENENEVKKYYYKAWMEKLRNYAPGIFTNGANTNSGIEDIGGMQIK